MIFEMDERVYSRGMHTSVCSVEYKEVLSCMTRMCGKYRNRAIDFRFPEGWRECWSRFDI